MVVCTDLCHLCTHLDAKKEIAKTILTIYDAIIVCVVGTKTINIALFRDLSKILSERGFGDSAGKVFYIIDKCSVVLTRYVRVLLETCELSMHREGEGTLQQKEDR